MRDECTHCGTPKSDDYVCCAWAENDALRARLAEAEEIISTAARYWSVPGSSAYERKLLANAVAWIARGSVNGDERHD